MHNTKKLTYNFVRKKFEKEGYTLISQTYKNAHSKLEYICSNGHGHAMIWNSWQQGQRCPYCSGKAKKDIDFVRKKFKKEGYVLISPVYKNSCSKLEYICPKGHNHATRWTNWQQGQRCVYCSGMRYRNWAQEKINSFITYRGYVRSITDKNYRKYKHIINPNNLKRGRNKYHLDHIYSVYDGFENNIDPKIISNPINLRMMKESDNISKSKESHISIKKLHRDYFKFDRQLSV